MPDVAVEVRESMTKRTGPHRQAQLAETMLKATPTSQLTVRGFQVR